MMKRPICLLIAAAATTLALPAQNDQEALIQKRDEKLSQDWVTNANWILDYDEARAAAKETGKPIFAYFTRSYSP